ncbi:MAG: hypothetical protein L0Y66_23100 [Myxococcaceae bacterium]|nr:hypothetical protein [Myxococcaceae bacterium]MCI0673917.1 hypothetical protein [Myxococcaceae bacterium]
MDARTARADEAVPSRPAGASQALEDALALGAACAADADVPRALAAYEASRKVRASGFQKGSRRVGRLSNVPGALGLWVREQMWRRMPAETSVRRLVEATAHPLADG